MALASGDRLAFGDAELDTVVAARCVHEPRARAILRGRDARAAALALARDGGRVRGGSVVLLRAGVVTDEATLRALLTRLTDVADGLDRAAGSDSTR